VSILIAGGGGYIGIVLAEELLEAGRQVTVFDRFYFGADLLEGLQKYDNLKLVRGDVRVIEASDLDGFTTVVDLAGLSNDPSADLNPMLAEEINISGATRVVRLAKQVGVSRYLYSSSCSIYGQGQGILTEESPPHPVSLYAQTKIAAEKVILELADDSFCPTVLRNATVFGVAPRMRFDLVVNLMTLYAFKHRKVFVLGGGEQWRPLLHVRDVARAFLTALAAPPEKVGGQIFNVGDNEQNYKVKTVARLVSSVVAPVTVEEVPQDPDKRSYRVSFDKIRSELGYQTKYDVAYGIREVYEALTEGRIEESIRTKTVAFYKHLLDAERLVREVSIDGKVF
jgi:nucleoside-diphosphate-sugar epimerase